MRIVKFGSRCADALASVRFVFFDTLHRTMVRHPKNVPADIVVPVTDYVAPIWHLDVGQQKSIILRNAQVSRFGGEAVELISQHEHDELSKFLDQALLDSDRAAIEGSGPTWHSMYHCAYHGLIRCLRLRAAGQEYDFMQTLCQIQHKFSK